MADPPPKKKRKKNLFVRFKDLIVDIVEWVEEHIGDPAISAQLRSDLGLEPDGPTEVEIPTDQVDIVRSFGEKAGPGGKPIDPDVAAFNELVEAVKQIVEAVTVTVEAIKDDDMSVADVLTLIAQVATVESLRVRSPILYSLARTLGFVANSASAEEVEFIDALKAADLLEGDSSAITDRSPDASALDWVNLIAAAVTNILANSDDVAERVRLSYGFDPEPGSQTPGSDVLARRAATLLVRLVGGVTAGLTAVPVPKANGGPAVVLGVSGQLVLDLGDAETSLRIEVDAASPLRLFVPLDGQPFDADFGTGASRVRVDLDLRTTDEGAAYELALSDSAGLGVERVRFVAEASVASLAARLELIGVELFARFPATSGFFGSMPTRELRTRLDLVFVWDEDGFRLEGGSGLRVTLPVELSVHGVFTIQHAELGVGPSPTAGRDVALEASMAASFELGLFSASFDRVGLLTDVRLSGDERKNLWLLDVDFGFKPPSGVGLVLDGKGLKGGGFLFIDPDGHTYMGVLELKVGSLGLKAFGILDTDTGTGRGWSLLLLVFAEFRDSPVPLGLGFTLTAAGGVIGLEHTVSVDGMRAALGTGAYDDVLFPKDAVANAPRILGRLRALFPTQAQRMVLGVALELNWGGKAPVVTARLAVIFDLDRSGSDTRLDHLVVLGTIRIVTPPETVDAPRLVQIICDVLGVYDTETRLLAIDAQLRDSKIVSVAVTGTLIGRFGLGDDPTFVLSVGGFHPDFKDLPPRLPAKITRVGLTWKFGKSVTVNCELKAYAAFTASTKQLGADFSIKAKVGPVGLEGQLAFDVLIQDDGRVSAHIVAKVKITFKGHTLAGIKLDLKLERSPEQVWRAVGTATFEILWWDYDVDIDESWGEPRSLPATAMNVVAAVRAALGDADNWAAALPLGGEHLVSLAPGVGPVADGAKVLAHPLGVLRITQQVAPLGLDLDHVDASRVDGPTRFSVTGVQVGTGATAAPTTVSLPFTRARYQTLTDAERLSAPSFEPLPAGVDVASARFVAPAGAPIVAGYESINLGPPGVVPRPPRVIVVPGSRLSWQLLGAEASLSPLRVGDRLRPTVEPRVRVRPPRLVATAAGSVRDAGVLTADEARSPLLARQRAAASGLRVVEASELVP